MSLIKASFTITRFIRSKNTQAKDRLRKI